MRGYIIYTKPIPTIYINNYFFTRFYPTILVINNSIIAVIGTTNIRKYKIIISYIFKEFIEFGVKRRINNITYRFIYRDRLKYYYIDK